ncbi:MAG: hypothetical protein NT167_29685, partial [Verrucomicrobia bacterium]|nr:hypothetical protein [Verrucomicrobiota bacterium]
DLPRLFLHPGGNPLRLRQGGTDVKSEVRSPKSETRAASRCLPGVVYVSAFSLRPSVFGLLSAFDLRPSDFPSWNVS